MMGRETMTSRKPTYTKLPIEKQTEIKNKFLEGYNLSALAKEYDLTPQALGYYAKAHNWSEQRRLMRAELFQSFSDTKRAAFTNIYMDSVTFLRTTLRDVIDEYEKGNMRIKDKLDMADKIAAMVSKLDRIQRLDAGTPTEITEEKPFNVKELTKQLKRDPFYQETIDEAPFKEIDRSDDN